VLIGCSTVDILWFPLSFANFSADFGFLYEILSRKLANPKSSSGSPAYPIDSPFTSFVAHS
jgi:hypothetical protein